LNAPTSPLSRALADTVARNAHRPAIDYATFDASKVPREHRDALAFLVVNMEHIEATSTASIANIAMAAPLPEVSACFSAQVNDEIAHGNMLARWLSIAEMSAPVHLWTKLAVRAAALTQKNAWLGIANAEILTEHYAAALLDELMTRVDEPCLRSIFAHIAEDEARHKVIAAESLRALREAGHHRGLAVRLGGVVVENGTVAYFKHVFGAFLRGPIRALDLDADRILERALDEVADARA
jgi:hypothetical protein